MTNIMNTHTCTVCCMDLVGAVVCLTGGEPVEIMCYVVSSTRIRVPRGINRLLMSSVCISLRGSHCHGQLALRAAAVVAEAEVVLVEAF